MKAILITSFKDISPSGDIIEMKVWRVSSPVPPAHHSYKYSLVYIVEGKRVIGFDNERGKGDHKHLEQKEYDYEFHSIDQLIEDFIEDFIEEVDRWKNTH